MELLKQTQQIQGFIQSNPEPAKIDDFEIKKIYQNLIDCISDHNHLYYVNSTPIISDYEYDQLFAYLTKIEQNFPYIISGNSPTQNLINQIQEGFNKGEHKAPLLSLENSYNTTDILERENRAKKIAKKEGIDTNFKYIIEPKFDGLSVELIYKDGILIQGITRGDGYIGEDVTENTKKIRNIPKQLKIKIPGICSFRGEVVIGKDELEKINKEREKDGLAIYANTRNLASGSLKQLDTSITAQRNLECYIYETLFSETKIDKTFQELGLPVHHRSKNLNTIQQVQSICEDPQTKKLLDQDNISFDGLVIKILGDDIRKKIGNTNHHPRWAIAYKFPAEQFSTQIESVDFQIGRTGIITPVANLTPIKMSGATISRVSLHNFDFIKEKDIHYKDFVWIQRSGEVIPYITGVIKESRSDEKIITAPTICPSCNGKIVNIDIHYYCENPDCPAQLREKIIRFVSKGCMDIEGIGESIAKILVEQNIVKNISDLYKLLDFETERIVRKFPGFADKKLKEIKKQLKDSKDREFGKLLNGLGIPGIGKKTAQDISVALSEKFVDSTTLNDITPYLTDREFLIGIYGLGDKIVDGIIQYRNNNLYLLQNLEKLGLNFNCHKASPRKIKGKFSITGSFPIPREEIIGEMEKNGFTFDSSPNRKTDIMLVGEKPGNKLQKAEELGIKIIQGRKQIQTEYDFFSSITGKEIQTGPTQIGLF